MENTSYVALSRQNALWRQLEVTANNMANANTPAYKAQQVMFTDYLVKTKSDNTPFGRQVAFAQDVGVLRDTREGPMAQTGAPLDMAIHDNGFFVIDTPAGQRFTRSGHFRLDETGMAVNASGYPVLQQNGQPIVFAPNETQISISGDGTISTENGVIGKIRVVKFENEQALKEAGAGMFQSAAEPINVDKVSITQGALEQSNVQTVSEVTNMISITRNYEGVQKMIESENERQLKAMKVLSSAQTQSA
jgi:flagellar basal-body rod protein FlgF